MVTRSGPVRMGITKESVGVPIFPLREERRKMTFR